MGPSRKHSTARKKSQSTSSSASVATLQQRVSIGERAAGDEELVNDSGHASKESDEGACQTTSDSTLVRETTDLCSVPEDEKREAQESGLTPPTQRAAAATSDKPTRNATSAIVPANASEYASEYGARSSFSARRGNEQQLFRRPLRKSIAFDDRRVLEDIESVREEEVRSPPQEPDAEPSENVAEEDGVRARERDERRASETSFQSSSVAEETNKERESTKARMLRIVSISVFSYAALAIFCLLCAVVIMWIESPSEQEAKVHRRAELAQFAAHYSHFCIRNASDLLAFTTRVLDLKDIVEELQPGFTNDIWTFDRSLIFIFTVVSSIGKHCSRRENHNMLSY